MAENDLAPGHMEAGGRYCTALENLGLDLAAAMWVFDKEEGHHSLLLVTDIFDYAGPLQISRKLFDAYNTSEDFKEINPFRVIVRGNTAGLLDQLGHLTADTMRLMSKETGEPKGEPNLISSMSYAGMEFRSAWLLRTLKAPKKKRQTIVLSRRWKRFSENVDHLKAAA